MILYGNRSLPVMRIATMSRFTRIHTCLLRPPVLFVLFLCGISFNVSASSSSVSAQFDKLDDQFKVISEAYYTANNTSTQPVIRNIDKLQSIFNEHMAHGRSIQAVQLLYANINTIKRHIDHPSSFEFLGLLLQENEWKLAVFIYEELKVLGDRTLLATGRFLFAKYHADRQQWQQVYDLLDGQLIELSNSDMDYGYLLHGTALQNLKRHRDAADSYKKISVNSQYYDYAQLNKAITDIRQGWWSDAQSTINTLLANSKKDNSDELINRLNLVLGYALLQHEYYRNARQAFRRIGLHSHYTNRALLGITLSATSQGDYIGGLNALKILKQNTIFDLSVDESYLLFPYVYEQLQQQVTVTASYTEAMEYYQSRINELNKAKSINYNLINTSYNKASSSIIINNNAFDLGRNYPESFFKNYQKLGQLINLSKSQRLTRKMHSLMEKYNKAFNQILSNVISERIEYLNSYLNQSRYGLARLYDNNQKTN